MHKTEITNKTKDRANQNILLIKLDFKEEHISLDSPFKWYNSYQKRTGGKIKLIFLFYKSDIKFFVLVQTEIK